MGKKEQGTASEISGTAGNGAVDIMPDIDNTQSVGVEDDPVYEMMPMDGAPAFKLRDRGIRYTIATPFFQSGPTNA